MVAQNRPKSNELKYITKSQLIEEARKVKEDIHSNLVNSCSYILQDYESDIEHLIAMFFNEVPYDNDTVELITKKIEAVFSKFGVPSTINDLITALKLGYLHHVEHITTSQMSQELGITRQGLQRYLFDVTDPESVKKAQQKKHPMIPVRKYVSIVTLAEKLDFEKFKRWYLNRRGAES